MRILCHATYLAGLILSKYLLNTIFITVTIVVIAVPVLIFIAFPCGLITTSIIMGFTGNMWWPVYLTSGIAVPTIGILLGGCGILIYISLKETWSMIDSLWEKSKKAVEKDDPLYPDIA